MLTEPRGLAALLCAASTCVFSWLILFAIHNRKELDTFKPASWLSALLSLNSIALHIALSEGVTVAWWYTASRKDATFKQLHETWRFGHSLGAVLLSGNKFNYVALATIFVATVPLNGLLLQNAISMVPFTSTNHTTIKIPMSQTWPVGFSAQYNEQSDTVGIYNDAFWYSTLLTFSLYKQRYYYVPSNSEDTWTMFHDSGCYNRNNTAVCHGKSTSVGFKSTCHTTKIPYDLRPHSQDFTARVFDSSVTWTPTQPNTINITVSWKPQALCQGYYYRKTCLLEAANVNYPVQMYSSEMEGSGSQDAKHYQVPIIALDIDATMENDTVHNPLPVAAGEGKGNTTYGGLAHALGSRYNSTLDWSYTNGSWSVKSRGSFAGELAPSIGFMSDPDASGNYFNPTPTDTDFCKLTYLLLTEDDDEDGDDILDQIRGEVRQLAFMSCVMQFWKQYYDYWDSKPETAPDHYTNFAQKARATQVQDLLQYHVRFIFWAASLLITLSICGMIAPTFYGFWKLNKAASLSPFDTAAAFKAPMLYNQGWESKHTNVLLKEIGKRHVHSKSVDWNGQPHNAFGQLTREAFW